jgi:hypothetical protein
VESALPYLRAVGLDFRQLGRAGIVLGPAFSYMEATPDLWSWPMIYILAVLIPPLALLLNGQPLSAVLNVILIVFCVIFGLIFPVLFLVPSIHGVIGIYMKREDRRHRELVDAIEKHGPPPGWRP